MSGKPILHGSDHLPGHADPIDGFIAFDTDNQGGYLTVVANAGSPLAGWPGGINLVEMSGEGMNLISGGGAGILIYAGLDGSVTWPGSVSTLNVNPVIIASDGGLGAPSVVVGINGDVPGDCFAVYNFHNAGDVWFKVENFIAYVNNIQNINAGGLFLDDFSGVGIGIDGHDGGVSFWARGGSDFIFQLIGGGNFRIDGLPTSSPGGSGKLWNNSGVVNVT